MLKIFRKKLKRKSLQRLLFFIFLRRLFVLFLTFFASLTRFYVENSQNVSKEIELSRYILGRIPLGVNHLWWMLDCCLLLGCCDFASMQYMFLLFSPILSPSYSWLTNQKINNNNKYLHSCPLAAKDWLADLLLLLSFLSVKREANVAVHHVYWYLLQFRLIMQYFFCYGRHVNALNLFFFGCFSRCEWVFVKVNFCIFLYSKFTPLTGDYCFLPFWWRVLCTKEKNLFHASKSHHILFHSKYALYLTCLS